MILGKQMHCKLFQKNKCKIECKDVQHKEPLKRINYKSGFIFK